MKNEGTCFSQFSFIFSYYFNGLYHQLNQQLSSLSPMYTATFPRLCIHQQKFFRPNGLSVLVS